MGGQNMDLSAGLQMALMFSFVCVAQAIKTCQGIILCNWASFTQFISSFIQPQNP